MNQIEKLNEAMAKGGIVRIKCSETWQNAIQVDFVDGTFTTINTQHTSPEAFQAYERRREAERNAAPRWDR